MSAGVDPVNVAKSLLDHLVVLEIEDATQGTEAFQMFLVHLGRFIGHTEGLTKEEKLGLLKEALELDAKGEG